MHITILGTRGEIGPSAPLHAKHAGVLVDGTILFDLGEREYLDRGADAAFITHLHPDHAFFVTDPTAIDIPLYAPEQAEHDMPIMVIEEPVTVGPYTVTPVPTHHSVRVKSTAYLLEKEEEKILYTGDVIWINREFHPLLEGCRLVITDGSLVRKGGRVMRDKESGKIYGHAGIPDLIDLFAPFTDHILFLHFGSWFFEDVEASADRLRALGEAKGVSVIVGSDGMEIDTGSL
ncbi:MAG: MBL fold metallo-hydrolase [Methanomicrobiaceae archaeon]|nr:MBL fold metallo-hydrolase [Methanomicrobiaceae archaeon]